MVDLDVLFNAATHTWPELRDAVRRAEDDGFRTAWVYDHLSGSVFASDRMLECFSLAGALAASTSTIGIGTLVVNAANRTAGMTVTAAASLQEISGGRFMFGLGAGAAPNTKWSEEQDLLGIPLPASMAARHERLVEVLDLCDELWDPNRDPKWAGFPLPTPRPPVLLGVNSAALAKVAGGRCEALNVRLGHPGLSEFFAAAVEERRNCARASTPLTLTAWTSMTPASLDPAGEIQGEFAALGGNTLILVR